MISHNNRCIFVHIPKVAGQSIELFFLKLHGLDWETRAPLLLRANDQPKIGPPRLAHLKLNDYLNFQYISPELFQEYFKFAFVRNPWSRTVSFFKYGRFNQVMSFQKFVEQELPKLIKNKEWFYGPQYHFIYEGSNSTNIDFIGRFEDINKDMMKVCQRLNIPFKQLPYRNESRISNEEKDTWHFIKYTIRNPLSILNNSGDQINSKDYKAYFDSNLINVIAELYHLDVEAFNYNFENTHYKT